MTSIFLSEFIDQAITQSLTVITNGTAVNCSDPAPFDNLPLDETINTTLDVLGYTVECTYNVTDYSNYSTLINSCFGKKVRCLDRIDFLYQVNTYTYIFVLITLTLFIVAFLSVFGFQAASKYQVKRIKLEYYRAIMRQEVGWFDTHSTGGLVSRIFK